MIRVFKLSDYKLLQVFKLVNTEVFGPIKFKEIVIFMINKIHSILFYSILFSHDKKQFYM